MVGHIIYRVLPVSGYMLHACLTATVKTDMAPVADNSYYHRGLVAVPVGMHNYEVRRSTTDGDMIAFIQSTVRGASDMWRITYLADAITVEIAGQAEVHTGLKREPESIAGTVHEVVTHISNRYRTYLDEWAT